MRRPYAAAPAHRHLLRPGCQGERPVLRQQAGERRHQREATWSAERPEGRWRCFRYDDLLLRDKLSLDITWLADESLDDRTTLTDPDAILAEILEDLGAALEQLAALQDVTAAATEAPDAGQAAW